MLKRISWLGTVLLSIATISAPQFTLAEQKASRQIDEVIVTAERKEASIQDTSISITAFTGDFLEDFGMRNQSDLQNYVPATTIQPYDATIRGVGRNFRALGGDPGVSTYMNGVYSEDLYTATVGIGFFDVERIEILRGPQGTLYGRNAIGGAMNIIYNKPTDEFEGKAQLILGDYGTQEVKAVFSGPLIENTLSGRMSLAKRERDGVVEERGIGDDVDSLDEDGIAFQLRWTPTENLEINMRVNDSNVDRIMGGANSAVAVVFTEEGNPTRNTTDPVFGWRAVDPAQGNFFASDFLMPGAIRTFTDPVTGNPVQAQHLRGGIDPSGGPQAFLNHFPGRPNIGFGAPDASDCMTGIDPSIDGTDACTYTNGLNFERFDQTGTQFSAEWDAADQLQIKYIFGYNDLFYDRQNDEDMTSSLYQDRQFYVNHEAEYYSHELVANWDMGDDLSFTSGIFYYNAKIDQRGDIYSSTADDGIVSVEDQRYRDPGNDLGFFYTNPFLFSGFLPNWNADGVNLYSARTAAQDSGAANGVLTASFGPWMGDANAGKFDVDHGPTTAASDLLYHTRTEREAYAAYTQGVWDMNDDFTLTFGLRWARDNLYGMENVFRYTEGNFGLLPTDDVGSPLGLSLAFYNVLTGALDGVTLAPTGAVPVRYHGVPLSLSAFREFDRSDTKATGRLNLDYNVDDDQLVYVSVTSGYRAGGYNLVFFSDTAEYDPEELIAYEFGYKSQLIDGTLQINGSVYYYDYSNIHTFGTEASAVGGTTTSVLEAPGAKITGIEAEILWLATDTLTLGGNFSYTPSEYTKSLLVSDETNPELPASLFNPSVTEDDIKGNQLLQVPEGKATLWGTYDIPLSSGNLQLLSSISWIDDVYYTPHESELTMAPSYFRWDARVTWKNTADDLVVSAFINNITDESGVRFISRDDETNGWMQGGQLSEPQLWGVEVTYKFGAF